MKKELLMGTALVSTLGAASVAEAVTASMSGNHQTGIEFDSPTGGTDTNAQINDNNFTVSLSETTDGGMTISSSFNVMDENTGEEKKVKESILIVLYNLLPLVSLINVINDSSIKRKGSSFVIIFFCNKNSSH